VLAPDEPEIWDLAALAFEPDPAARAASTLTGRVLAQEQLKSIPAWSHNKRHLQFMQMGMIWRTLR
jgi:hypothetical protein